MSRQDDTVYVIEYSLNTHTIFDVITSCDFQDISPYNTRLFKSSENGKVVYEVRLASALTTGRSSGANIQCNPTFIITLILTLLNISF